MIEQWNNNMSQQVSAADRSAAISAFHQAVQTASNLQLKSVSLSIPHAKILADLLHPDAFVPNKDVTYPYTPACQCATCLGGCN